MIAFPEKAAEPPAVEAGHELASFPHEYFHAVPAPMWIFDDQTLRFLEVNDAVVEKYGWSREEFLKMTIEDIRPPDELPRLRAYRDKAKGQKRSNAFTREVWKHTTKTGAQIEMETSWVEIPYPGHKAVLCVLVDRTQQRRAEEQSRQQAKLLDLASDAISVRDLQHRIVSWNAGAERLYGWRARETIGNSTHDLKINERADLDAAFAEVLQRGNWFGTLREKRKDGTDIYINSRWTLVNDDAGRPKSVLVINTDISEQKKLEQQFLRSQRLEAIGSLASGIAHDLNNILAPIMMATGMLRRVPLNPEMKRMIEIIEGSAERGAGIVKQVLTFARGAEGEKIPLQPKHLIADQIKVMAQTFPKNITTRSALGKDLWFVKGDATQLHQIILNLCVNARDAMPDGGTITIGAENADVDNAFASMHQGAKTGPHCLLSITDTGTGMSPEVMTKIFDPFFTTKEVGKGTGLGMATVLSIVRGHGGFITLQSEVGTGTTFKIYLPAVKDAAEAKKTEEITIPPGNGERILVVDDEMTVRQALIGTLEGHGYQVFSAEDGSDALALYFQWRDEIRLIITDLNMGQMDGIAFIRSVRKINPVAKVLVSSGHLTKEACAVLKTLGVLAGIEKPFTAKTLLNEVHTALNGHR